MDTTTVIARATDTLGRRVAPRRHRSIQEKQAIVAQALEPGASVAEVARQHGINANLLFVWRRLQERGLLETRTRRGGGRQLVRVKLKDESLPMRPASSPMLRIELPGGVQLHVGDGADVSLLERVIELLRR
jgi:transposase